MDHSQHCLGLSVPSLLSQGSLFSHLGSMAFLFINSPKKVMPLLWKLPCRTFTDSVAHSDTGKAAGRKDGLLGPGNGKQQC